MVVWEDRGVLKPPKPPTVHATERYIIVNVQLLQQFYKLAPHALYNVHATERYI